MRYIVLLMLFLSLAFSNSVDKQNKKNESITKDKYLSTPPPKVKKKKGKLKKIIKNTEVSGSVILEKEF